MSKVETGGDWAYLDQLDGVTLEDGEAVEVWFPDGTILLSTVVMEDEVRREAHDDIRYSDAFVEIEYHGITVRIPLNDDRLEVKRK